MKEVEHRTDCSLSGAFGGLSPVASVRNDRKRSANKQAMRMATRMATRMAMRRKEKGEKECGNLLANNVKPYRSQMGSPSREVSPSARKGYVEMVWALMRSL